MYPIREGLCCGDIWDTDDGAWKGSGLRGKSRPALLFKRLRLAYHESGQNREKYASQLKKPSRLASWSYCGGRWIPSRSDRRKSLAIEIERLKQPRNTR